MPAIGILFCRLADGYLNVFLGDGNTVRLGEGEAKYQGDLVGYAILIIIMDSIGGWLRLLQNMGCIRYG